TVLLKSGERIKCQSFARAGDTLELASLSVGPERADVPLAEVAALMPALGKVERPETDGACCVMLSDGSILKTRGGAELTSVDGRKLAPQDIVALWGETSTLTLPEDDAWPASGALLVERDKVYKPLAAVKFGAKWIEAEGLELFDYSYADSPIIWFRRPPVVDARAGLLRLSTGQQYVLGEGAAQTLAQWSEKGLSLVAGGQKFDVPFAHVLTLRLPR
ncbi:MAG: hypothetical protein KDA41_21665, partial [Planctomycetales bacterium]|nr:hypothetical protein [Planctomycetales bacterium]